MKNYSLLIFSKVNAPNIKLIFPLHEGDNSIGTSKDSDIYLELGENENIDPLHAKVILNKQNLLLDIGIKIIKSNKAYIKKEENENTKLLIPGKEYELSKNCSFYLNDNIKFKLIKGTMEEIREILLSNNLEKEFLKWHNTIINGEKEKDNKSNNIYSQKLKIDKNYKYNSYINYTYNNNIICNNNKIIRNNCFSIIRPKKIINENIAKCSNKYLTESLSNSFSFKSDNNMLNNISYYNNNNLLNLFNLNLNQEQIQKINQEKEKILKELLGENGLDNIINCTNFKRIRKYDRLYYLAPKKKRNKYFKN